MLTMLQKSQILQIEKPNLFPFRYFSLFVTFVGMNLFLTSCAPIDSDSLGYYYSPFHAPENINSEYAQLTYAYLGLEKAFADNDKDKVEEFADKILSHDPSAEPLIEVATWYFISGYFDDAQILLEDIIKADPDNFNNRLLLAEVLIELNQPDEAIMLLQNYIETHPENTNALVDLAVLYINLNQLDKANEIFSNFSEEQKNPITRYYYSQSLRALGYTEEARTELEKAVEEQPDFIEAIRELAILEEDNNNFEKAIQYYNSLWNYDEVNLDIITRLIRLNFLSQQHEEAYTVALKTHEPYAFMLSVIPVLMDEGNFDVAEQALNYIKAKNPNYEEILFYEAALAYEGAQDIPTALTKLYEVPKDSKNYYKALRLIIDLELAEQMYSEALYHTLEGLNHYKEDKELFVITLQLFITLDREAEALEFAQNAADKVIEEQSKSEYASEVLFYYAGLLISNNRGDESLVYFDKIFEINPNHYEAMNSLAYYYATQNINLDEAYDLVSTALEQDPQAAHMLDTLAWIKFRKGDKEQAYEIIRQAIAIQQEQGNVDPTLLEHYGFIALELGHKDIAQKALEDALQGQPENPEAIKKALENL